MTTDLVDVLADVLADRTNAEPALGFPRNPARSNRPGLYAWWADDHALELLAWSLGGALTPLIYAGQAGATTTRSRTVRAATLQSRISGNHLNGNVSSSTFRKTLSASLFQPLGLALAAPGSLDRTSNALVSEWMRRHLYIGLAPHDDRNTLATIEHAVLAGLDPPLNLMGMGMTVVRSKLSTLRRQLNNGGLA